MLLKQLLYDRFTKQIVMFSLSFLMGLLLLGVSFVGGDSIGALANPLKNGRLSLFEQWKQANDRVNASDSQIGEIADEPKMQAEDIPAPAPQIQPRSAYVAAKPGGFVFSAHIPLSFELQQYTYAKCMERGLEYETVLALMWRESRFELDAVNINTNGTQDSGIMQINDTNKDFLLEHYDIDDLMDPVQNIDAGTLLLSMYQRKYGAHDALMAYQYGENGMEIQQNKGVVTNDLIELLYDRRDYYRSLLIA